MHTLMEHNLFWRLLRPVADKDVISRGFCLDGFTLLSAAPGARLTNALRPRLHAGPTSDAWPSATAVRGAPGLCHTVSSSSLRLSFFVCFLSAHLLFIRQLHTLDFPQTSATSGHHANSASGLLLNRLSSDNRLHVAAATEKRPSKQAADEASKQGENAEMAL